MRQRRLALDAHRRRRRRSPRAISRWNCGDQLGRILEIAVEQDRRRRRSRSRIPLVNALWEPKLRVWLMTTTSGSRRGELGEHLRGVVRASVVDEDDLVVDAEPLEVSVEPLVHDRDRRGVAVAGDDRAELVSSGGRRRPDQVARSSASSAVGAIAVGDRPCASFEERLATRRLRQASTTPQRTTAAAEPVSAIDLGDERAEAAVDVVRLDGDRERDAAQRRRPGPRSARGSGRRDDEARSPCPEPRASVDGARRPRARSSRWRRARRRARRRSARRAPSRSGRRARHRRPSRLAEPEVDGPGQLARLATQRRARLREVGRRDDGHPRLRAHHRDVLERVVREPLWP